MCDSMVVSFRGGRRTFLGPRAHGGSGEPRASVPETAQGAAGHGVEQELDGRAFAGERSDVQGGGRNDKYRPIGRKRLRPRPIADRPGLPSTAAEDAPAA